MTYPDSDFEENSRLNQGKEFTPQEEAEIQRQTDELQRIGPPEPREHTEARVRRLWWDTDF